MRDVFAFARARAQRLRMVFFCAILLCILYYLSWRLWEWSSLPGLAVTIGSYPWSWPWLEFGMRAGLLPWNTRDAITLAMISAAFGLNCTIAYGVFAWFRRSK